MTDTSLTQVPLQPPGGWPAAMVRMELSHCADENDAAVHLVRVARQLLLGVGGELVLGGPPMVAWPHQESGDVLIDYTRRRRLAGAAPGRDFGEVLIDGTPYPVHPAVRAYCLRLADSNRHLADAASKLQDRLELSKARAPQPPESGHWTANVKRDVVRAIHGGHLTRERALVLYALSDEELQQWEAAQ